MRPEIKSQQQAAQFLMLVLSGQVQVRLIEELQFVESFIKHHKLCGVSMDTTVGLMS